MKPRHLKELQSQSRRLRARRVDKHTMAVESASNPAANHIVTVTFEDDGTVHARCTCPWAINHGIACSHTMAALEFLATRKGRKLSFWSTLEEAKRQKHRVFFLTANGIRSSDGVWITSRAG